MNELYNMMDDAIAGELGIPVEEYIQKIESISQEECDRILLLLFSSNDDEILLGKKLFFEIKL